MGTSSAFGGPVSGTPLVPSWLQAGAGDDAGPQGSAPADSSPGSVSAPVAAVGASPSNRPASRFGPARRDFSRFARSGGSDRASLARAVARYVTRSAGGAAGATRRMGASRAAGASLVGFLADAVRRGGSEALQTLRLGHLSGKPLPEILLAVSDVVCPAGGSIDQGIARDAWVETIAQVSAAGITDIDSLNMDQVQTVFETYATFAIMGRLCNDIGTKVLSMPSDHRVARVVERQLQEFIRGGVADALRAAGGISGAMAPPEILKFVTHVYQQAFGILRALGEETS